jgi:hypothetical protein
MNNIEVSCCWAALRLFGDALALHGKGRRRTLRGRDFGSAPALDSRPDGRTMTRRRFLWPPRGVDSPRTDVNEQKLTKLTSRVELTLTGTSRRARQSLYAVQHHTALNRFIKTVRGSMREAARRAELVRPLPARFNLRRLLLKARSQCTRRRAGGCRASSRVLRVRGTCE